MKHTVCQNCGIKEATVFYREQKNGAERELYLCPDCAAQLGIGDLQENLFSSFSLFSPNSPFSQKAEPKQSASCPLCGTTLSQIRRRGKFGCSTCYDTFARLLDLTPFVGKGYDARAEKEFVPNAEEKTVSEVDAWKAELKKAIAAEDYERAAVLRDKIREKEGE
ncbi:MAG: hypothetical protein E7580_01520 [Ruminococcaceae bacterium]|nr:hypothetical protein [Oscillospiraceae bacterium]